MGQLRSGVGENHGGSLGASTDHNLVKWREAWRWSIFHTDHWTEQVPGENWVDEVMEIQPLKEMISLQRANAKMSWSFDNQMFRERYSEKQWNASWKVHQQNLYGSSGISGKSISNTEHGSNWGRSFRLANPMPQVEQPWVESSSNLCHYTVIWSRRENIQNKINTYFNNNPAILRLWGNSHKFLQGGSARSKVKSKPKDSRVIVTVKTKTRKHLYSTFEKEKQSERKWAGCQLLGKTQPRPKRGTASVKKLKKDDPKDTFFEEWAESWRFFFRPGKQRPMKTLSGWVESWKFLLPPYQPLNGPKVK
ncbi:uncharacterized protein AKAME5_000478600 [Lates japonicus]|uniref:Uncharacterized protein n=1 Tax=Lates japonicus TaxID=270547 RepID=A0AAD3MCC4_LATJO|nr:uncharacterized protein AKAME5_000478600 [Lates japonicus]